VLTRAAGRTEEQVKELVAAMAPRPAPDDLLRRLPAPRSCSSGPELQLPIAPVSSGPETQAAQPSRPAARIEPISEELRVLRVTVGADFTTDLAAVRAALSHKIPDGNLVAVLHECLRVTLAAATKRRRGTGRACPTPVSAPGGRYIPAAIRDAVWRRDDGRCAFVSADGRRCDSTHQLELHHLVPFARGGAATLDGLALRCKAHNLHEARRDFGDEHIEHVTARARRARSAQLDL
jgi:5-methylcytosine-specific restriction endonuclease McrA